MVAKVFSLILAIRILLNSIGLISALDLSQPWSEGRIFCQFVGIVSFIWCIAISVWMTTKKAWHLKYLIVMLIVVAALSIPLIFSDPNGVFFCLGFK